MLTDPDHIDKRYMKQTQWSMPLRDYIYRKLPVQTPLSILEVGCGTGAVIRNVHDELAGKIRLIAGVDKDPGMAGYAYRRSPGFFCVGEGEKLPFPDDCFDFVFCHYLLLWVRDPAAILREMKRVTVPGGVCAAMAEPCYSEMIASPEQLRKLAEIQRDRLIGRGADDETGRELGNYFREAGFGRIEFGQYRKCEMTADYLNAEIRQMAEDAGMTDPIPEPDKEYDYYVPTYYAIAMK